jgi:hypothetical protein
MSSVSLATSNETSIRSRFGRQMAIVLFDGAWTLPAPDSNFEVIAMKKSLLSVFAVAAIGLTCAGSAIAGTSVVVTYAAPAVVYAPPPPRPVYYVAPPPAPYYYAPARAVVVAPPVYAPPVRAIYGAPVVFVR